MGYLNGYKKLMESKEKPRSDETSFLQLRNRLAHGGGITRKEYSRLLGIWENRIQSALDDLQWITSFQLIGKSENGKWFSLQGKEATKLEQAPESLEGDPDSLWVEVQGQYLQLWPMAAFGFPRLMAADKEKVGKAECPLIYVRKEPVRLGLVPLGAEDMGHAESSPEAAQAFDALFKEPETSKKSAYKVNDFLKNIREDAGKMVGRHEELDSVLAKTKEKKTGVFWISGPAGMGKSCLVAKVATELMDSHEMEGRVILSYRMRSGDMERCNRGTYAQFVIERLAAAEVLAEHYSDKPKENATGRLKKCLASLKEDASIVLILDGLDEIARNDPDFTEEVPLAIRYPGVLWVCAGRPESTIVEPMRRLGADTLFPAGLPPMGKDDIRGMILEKIGPLRKKLLGNDKEKEEEVVNTFIDQVAERAAGLPIYVNYVIGDINKGKYRVLDGDEDLPEGLNAYHEELLRRMGIGDLQAVLTPIVAMLAVSYEPLSTKQLTSMLESRTIIEGSKVNLREDRLARKKVLTLVENAVSAISSMLTFEERIGERGPERYCRLYHQSLRDHIHNSPSIAYSLKVANTAFTDLALMESPAREFRDYALRHSVRHLIEQNMFEEAKEKLLDLDFLYWMRSSFPVGEADCEIAKFWEDIGNEKSIQYVNALIKSLKEESRIDFWEKAQLLLDLSKNCKWIKCYLEISKVLCDEFPDNLHYLIELGNAYISHRYFERAKKVLIMALEICKNLDSYEQSDFLWEIFEKLGESYLYSGNFNCAIDYFQKARQESYRDIIYNNYIGVSYLAMGDFENAINYFVAAEELIDSIDPDWLWSMNCSAIYRNLAEAYAKINDTKQIDAYRKKALDYSNNIKSNENLMHHRLYTSLVEYKDISELWTDHL